MQCLECHSLGLFYVASFKMPSPTFKPDDHKGCVENLDLAMVHLGAMIASGVQPGQIVDSSTPLVASSTSEPTVSPL